jgi:hypothetical protein
VAVAVVALVGLAAGWRGERSAGSAIVRVGDTGTDAGPDTGSAPAASPTTGAPAAPATTAGAPVAGAAMPHRVLLLGDSLVWTQRDALAAQFAAVGVETRFAGGSGTGPLTAQSGWIRELASALDDFHPDAVVVEACCNYGASPEHPEYDYYLDDGTPVPADTELMYDLWAAADEEIVQRAEATGATVWWVVTPPVDPQSAIAGRLDRFNRIARQLADDHPALRYLDWASAVTTPNGRLYDPVTRSDGTTTPLRVDGLHFTDAGRALLTDATVRAVTGMAPAYPGHADGATGTA